MPPCLPSAAARSSSASNSAPTAANSQRAQKRPPCAAPPSRAWPPPRRRRPLSSTARRPSRRGSASCRSFAARKRSAVTLNRSPLYQRRMRGSCAVCADAAVGEQLVELIGARKVGAHARRGHHRQQRQHRGAEEADGDERAQAAPGAFGGRFPHVRAQPDKRGRARASPRRSPSRRRALSVPGPRTGVSHAGRKLRKLQRAAR